MKNYKIIKKWPKEIRVLIAILVCILLFIANSFFFVLIDWKSLGTFFQFLACMPLLSLWNVVWGFTK
jgi:energy-coupling factor transporter transmembrane protein EcfT